MGQQPSSFAAVVIVVSAHVVWHASPANIVVTQGSLLEHDVGHAPALPLAIAVSHSS
jgi:hypothetical protein